MPALPVELTERAAFKAMIQFGGTIYDLSRSEAHNPEAAIENAEAVAAAKATDYLTDLQGADITEAAA